MGEGQYLDMILLAMVAGFVVLRLRSVLGRRTGHERPPQEMPGVEDRNEENVVNLPDRSEDHAAAMGDELPVAEESAAGQGLRAIMTADRSFEPNQFLEGANAAYEMIVDAFAKGDRQTLGNLLSEAVFNNFDAAINARENAGHVLETTVVALQSADIVEAGMNGSMAEVTVRIVAETISALRDEDGELVDGASLHPYAVHDIWTFARDTKARNPNWALIETRSEN